MRTKCRGRSCRSGVAAVLTALYEARPCSIAELAVIPPAIGGLRFGVRVAVLIILLLLRYIEPHGRLLNICVFNVSCAQVMAKTQAPPATTALLSDACTARARYVIFFVLPFLFFLRESVMRSGTNPASHA